MRKLLFLLVFLLFMWGTFQKEGKRRNKKRRNGSALAVAVPRTFFASLVFEEIPNGTHTPVSARALPALHLLSDGTVEYLRGPVSTRVIPVVYILAIAVGIPANVAILCLLATKIRKVSSAILYCSLAASDLFLLLSLLFKVHYHLHGNDWALGETACRLVTACFYGNLYCSSLTLACISIKRYLAVAYPFMYKRMPKRTCAAWVSLAVWVAFGAAVGPELVVRQSYWLPQLNRTTCHDVLPLYRHSHGFLLYHNLILSVLGLLLPLAVTVVCFGRIICELNRSHFDWAMYIKASSLVLGMFLVCFLPAGALHFLHYVQLFADRTESLYVYFSVAVCLCCLHACLDPFLFVLMSKSAGSRLYFMTFKGKTVSISI
ncbi:unnamed protein product [Ophioblennius macclurei]